MTTIDRLGKVEGNREEQGEVINVETPKTSRSMDFMNYDLHRTMDLSGERLRGSLRVIYEGNVQ